MIQALSSAAFLVPGALGLQEAGFLGLGLLLGLPAEVAAALAIARFRPQEHLPGPSAASDEDLLAAAAALGTTIFHPVGTAKMGSDGDPRAVLDERLRVRGIKGLRVIDASVMPAITSGNTANPTMMIAEKGAAMMIEDARAG